MWWEDPRACVLALTVLRSVYYVHDVIHGGHDALLAWIRFLLTVLQICIVHHCELMYGAFPRISLKSPFFGAMTRRTPGLELTFVRDM